MIQYTLVIPLIVFVMFAGFVKMITMGQGSRSGTALADLDLDYTIDDENDSQISMDDLHAMLAGHATDQEPVA